MYSKDVREGREAAAEVQGQGGGGGGATQQKSAKDRGEARWVEGRRLMPGAADAQATGEETAEFK